MIENTFIFMGENMKIDILNKAIFVIDHEQEEIVILNNVNNADIYTMDISANGDGSVVGWYSDDGKILYIAPTIGDKIYIDDNAPNVFSDCDEIKYIKGLENIDMSKNRRMLHMFKGCSSLKELDLYELDLSNITTMEGLFNGCRRLNKVIFPKLKKFLIDID